MVGMISAFQDHHLLECIEYHQGLRSAMNRIRKDILMLLLEHKCTCAYLHQLFTLKAHYRGSVL